MSGPDSYDTCTYRSAAYKVGHPDRLATVATLFGLMPAPVPRCRVLELGCGDGSHLIPVAFSYPGSAFTGIDLARRPIAAGQAMAEHLGIRNLRLRTGDILEVTSDLGEFDYIIAHGVYSWVPLTVQDKVLEICRSNLAPHGVAFVSYNAYPGSKLKEAARDFFQHFIRPLDSSPPARARARDLLGWARRPRPEAGSWNPIMRQVCEFLGQQPDTILAHDEMAPEYRPAYFHQFVEHARRHGLQYLGEAEFFTMNDRWLTPEELRFLRALPGDPLLLREQYMDFLKCRSFRQTLLCRQEEAVRRDNLHGRAQGLLVGSRLRNVEERPQPAIHTPERFQSPDGSFVSIGSPPAKRLLKRMENEWPRRLPVCTLASEDFPARNVGELLVELFGMGLIELQTHWLPYVSRPGLYPEASLLARLQLDRRSQVTSREYADVDLEDPVGQELVRRCDGTRDRAALLTALRRLDPDVTAASLENNLRILADLALLTA